MADTYNLKHNIHSSDNKLSHLKWIKAPYRYRLIYRAFSSFILIITLFLISISSYLLFLAWYETPENKYRSLVKQHLSSFVRDLVNNAPRDNMAEYKSTNIRIPLLMENLITEGYSYREAISFLALYIEKNQAKVPSVDELRSFVLENQNSSNKDTFLKHFPKEFSSDIDPAMWQKKEDWYRSKKHFESKDELEEQQKRHVFDELLGHYAYVRKLIPNTKGEGFFVQLEGIKHHRIVSLEVSNQRSSLPDNLHLKYPFFTLLHYSQRSLDTSTYNPQIDTDAPFQLILSDDNVEQKIFDVSRIIDIQALLKEYNVIFNLGTNTLLLNDEATPFFSYENFNINELNEILRSYFTRELQFYIHQVGDWNNRVPNLLVGLRIDPERIYELDKRPVVNSNNPSWLDVLNRNYNIISRAEIIERFIPYLLLCLIISIVVFFILIARLFHNAGYVANRHGEIPENALPSSLFRLSFIDYIPLELLFIILVVASFIIKNQIQIFSLTSISFVFLFPLISLLVIITLLSILRRYRGGVLLDYSIFYFACNLVGRMQKKWKWSIAYGSLLFVIFYFTWTNNYIGLAILVGLFFILGLSYSLDMDFTRQRISHILGREDDPFGRRILPRGWFMKKLDQDLDDLQQLLDSSMMSQLKSEKLKTELITNVSHDLKTPLTSIVNYANLLRRLDVTDEVKEYIERIYSNSVRLQTLTENLLEASKAASGTLKCECIIVDLNEFMKQMCGEWVDRLSEGLLYLNYRVYDENNLFYCMSFSSELGEDSECPIMKSNRHAQALLKGQTIEEADTKRQQVLMQPCFVYVDPELMVRIFDNLMGNTLKYSISNSRIFINLKVEKNAYILEMVNTSNQKIDMSTDQLMERFIQGDISRRSEGSGLGLSIVKSLADMMNVEFEVGLDQDQFKACLRFSKLNDSLDKME